MSSPMIKCIPVVVVHGGAGRIDVGSRESREAVCCRAASEALSMLGNGGSSLDAAQRAVEILEDDPQFNAGTGASLTWDGGIELDAAIMSGTDLRAGAVAALPPFAHPIAIARRVLDDGHHVMYAGHGAARFAEQQGFTHATLEAMRTAPAIDRLAKFKRGAEEANWAGGTVGAVACDQNGRVAAATSTGGTVGKQTGRVGDSPILGAGTWADDETGAASATGTGEAILRFGLCRHACEGLRSSEDVQHVVDAAIARFGQRVGGIGGIILVSARAAIGISKNTETMSHAIARAGQPVVGGT